MQGLSLEKKTHYKNLMKEDLAFVVESLKTNTDKSEAFVRLNRLLNCDPDNHVYLYYMGTLFLSDKNFGSALPYFRQAIEQSNREMPEAFNNAGMCLRNLNRLSEANDAFIEAGKLRPCATYYGNIASYYVANATPDIAIDYCKKALELEPDDDSAKNNLACAYLEKGMYKEAWQIYDARFQIEENKKRKIYAHDLPFWDGTKGQTVVVCGEQGIGDEIMFASVLQDAIKDANIIFDAHDRLVSLFRRAFPNIPIYGTKRIFHAEWHKKIKIDAKIALGSLCKFYRNDIGDFPKTPYLKADVKYTRHAIEKMKQHGIDIDNDEIIGFSWKGGTQRTMMDVRYNDLENWLPIFKRFNDHKFISLQYHDDAKDILTGFCLKHKLKNLFHFEDILADYDLTAGLVETLDVVVSVPQSVVHLAGAMGKKVYQLTPYRALWQMGPHGQNMPWYSNVTNVWMKQDNDWPGVMQELEELLAK